MPSLFDPLQQLTYKTERKHTMTAHRGDFEALPVGDSIGLADKAQRVLDAMAFKTRTAGAFLSLIQRSADVNGKSKIGLFEFFDKGHSVVRIVKNRRN